MAKKKKAANDSPGFEESLADLEAVVADLESGELPLSASIKRYEEGVGLLKQCHQTLDQIQRKIELLTSVDDEGNAKTVPFEGEENDAAGSASSSASQEQEVDDSGRLF